MRKVALALVSLGVIGAGAFALFRHRDPPIPPSLPPSQAIIPNDMLNAASVKTGAKIFKMCAACHSRGSTIEPIFVGPPLAGIVGAPIARQPRYEYSDALRNLRNRYWTTDELYEWLRNPDGYAPATKMQFNGLLDPQDRWDLIAYLITLK